MSDFDPHISVDQLHSAKDANCNVKEITLDNLGLKLETPFKIISGKSLTDKKVSNFIEPVKSPLFEFEKYIVQARSYQSLINTLNEGGKEKDWIRTLNDSMGLRASLEDNYRKNNVLSIAFQHYPLDDVNLRKKPKFYSRMDKSLYETYLDYVYSASTAFILTPDVMIPSAASKRNFSIEEYLRFIEFSVKTFQDLNNKPIFVPIQIDLSSKDLRGIIGAYKKNGFSNIWINFKAQKCNGSHAGKLRVINRRIKEFFGEEAVVYCSHMKKDTDISHSPVPALDILPSFSGADFVGINRNHMGFGDTDAEELAKKKGFASKEEYDNALNESRCSIFDPTSYYYYVPRDYPRDSIDSGAMNTIQENKLLCSLYNNVEIYKELATAREEIFNTDSLWTYLESKEGVSQNIAIFNESVKKEPLSASQKKSIQRLLLKK